MRERTSKSLWIVLLLIGLGGLVSGCDRLGWANFNIVIDLGLDGETGLLSGFNGGSVFVPTNGGENEPPLPIQVGDQPGGGTGIGD